MRFRSRVLAPAILVIAGCTTSPRSMTTTDRLEGQWQCVSAVVDGAPLPEQTVQALRLTITQDRYKTEKAGQVLFDSTYRVDPRMTPKQIAMLGTEGELAGKEALGIYSLEGDLLRIGYTMPGGKRPESFESQAGSKVFLIVWKRNGRVP